MALESWWDHNVPVFRRSREPFRDMLRAAIPALLRLRREKLAAIRRWQDALPRHRSPSCLRDYLGIPTPRDEQAD